MKKCIICDIDGVYVDSSKWIPFIPVSREDREGWDYFAQLSGLCTPNLEIIKLLKLAGIFYPIIFITSREDNRALREATKAQLDVFSGSWIHIGSKHKLFMRPYRDYRDAWYVKKEIMEKEVLPYYKPIIAIDDDLDNILMYQALDIPTWHYKKFLER